MSSCAATDPSRQPKRSILKKKSTNADTSSSSAAATSVTEYQKAKPTALYLWQSLVDRACFQLQVSCIANPSVSEKYLEWTASLLHKRHYDEIVAERNAMKRCGNPCCAAEIEDATELAERMERGEIGRYKIDSKNLKVIDNLKTLYNRYCSEECQEFVVKFKAEQALQDKIPAYTYTDDALRIMKIVFPELDKNNLLKLKDQMDVLFGKSKKDSEYKAAVTLTVVEKSFSRTDKKAFSSSVYERYQVIDTEKASTEIDGYSSLDRYQQLYSSSSAKEQKNNEAKRIAELPKLYGTTGNVSQKVSFSITPPGSDDESDDAEEEEQDATGEPAQMSKEANEMLYFNKTFMARFLLGPYQEAGASESKPLDSADSEVQVYAPEPEFKPSQDKTIRMSKFGEFWTCLSDWVTPRTIRFMNYLAVRSGGDPSAYVSWTNGEEATGQEGHAAPVAASSVVADAMTPEQIRKMRTFQYMYKESGMDISKSEASSKQAQAESAVPVRRPKPKLPKRSRPTSTPYQESTEHVKRAEEIPAYPYVQPQPQYIVAPVVVDTNDEGEDGSAPLTEEELARLRIVQDSVCRALANICRDIKHPNIAYLDALATYLIATFSFEQSLPPFSIEDWKVVAGVALCALALRDTNAARGFQQKLLLYKLDTLGINEQQLRLLKDIVISGV